MAELAVGNSFLTSLAAGAVGSAVVSTLFAPDTPPPAAQAPAPVVEKPAVMPTPGDDTTRNAKRASIAEQQRRRGRASTILTDNGATSDPLGG